MSDLVGSKVGRYEVEERLGAGAMGEVYLARDPQLRRQVAIKRLASELSADPELRDTLLREARNAARITNQRVAALYDVLEEGEDLYLVMEHVKGTTLRHHLQGAMPEHEFLEIALQCVEGLGAAHHQGIVHGDIKPENIMLGPQREVKLLDFGVSRVAAGSEDATHMTTDASGEVGGTISYMSPEILMGHRSDHRADIFALGVVFYEMLAGHHPFRAETPMATSDRILHVAHVPLSMANPTVRPELQAAIDKMLAKNPEERYATMDDLAVDLRNLRTEITNPTVRPAQVAAPRPRRWWVVPAAAAALVLVAAVVWLGRGWFVAPAGEPRTTAGATVSFDASEWIIAVLPTGDTAVDDAELAALNDGLVATLTTRLTQLTRSHGLQVVPASAVRERGVSGLEMARRELGVTLALNFEARRIGDVVRINLSLVDTGGPRQIDADTVDGRLDDLIAFEEQVSLRALRMLRVELAPMEQGLLAAGTDQPRAHAYYLRGRGYLEDRNDPANADLAADLFEQALRVDPAYARAHADLGRAFWQKFELTEDPAWVARAADACREAVALDELDAGGRTCLGVLYNGTGRYQEAIEELEQARRLEPTDDLIYTELASAYLGAGQPERAEATHEAAIAVRPHYWGGYSGQGAFYYRQGRVEEAIAAWEQAAQLAPDSYRSFSNLGVGYFVAERWTDARRAFERSLQIYPDYETAVNNLGTLYFFEGRYADATRMFERATEAQQRSYLAWGNLGDGYYWTPGERQRAPQAYRRAIGLAQEQLVVNPSDAEVNIAMARYYAMLGDEPAARQSLDAALRLAATDMYVMYEAAQAHAILGDSERALELLLAAIDAGYQRAEIRVNPFLEELLRDSRLQAALGSG